MSAMTASPHPASSASEALRLKRVLGLWDLLIPLISAIIPALAIQRLLPGVPFAFLTFLVVLGMTGLNLGGIRTTARANTLLLAVTTAVVGWFLIVAVRYLFQRQGWGGIFS